MMRATEVDGILYLGDLGGCHGVQSSATKEKFYRRAYSAYLDANDDSVSHIVATPTFTQNKEKGYLIAVGFGCAMKNWGMNECDLFIIDRESFLKVLEEPSYKKEYDEYLARVEERRLKDIEEERTHPLYDIRVGDLCYKQGALRSIYKCFRTSDKFGRLIFKDLRDYETEYAWPHSIESPYLTRLYVE